MKRSIIFGALGCVWAALVITVTFTGSLTDFPSIYDQAYRMEDYRAISAAWFVLESVGLDAAAGLSFLVTLLVWLLLLRYAGFIGRRRPRPRRRFSDWLRAMGGVVGVVLRALAVIAAGYGLSVLTEYCSSLLGLDVIMFYSLGFVKGLFVWTLLEAGPSVFAVFALFSLLHAVFANDRFSGILKALTVPAAGVAAFFAATGAAYLAAGSMDVYGTLADTPGITSGETHDTLVVLRREPVRFTITLDFPELLLTSPRFGDEKPFMMTFCEQNEGAVCRYLQGGGMPSVQSLSAYDYIFAYRIRRLDMPGLMEVLEDAWVRTGEPIYWNLCLNWIIRGAKSEERHETLIRISDESLYNIPGRSAIRVSGAYAKYGDMERARYWFGKGMSGGRSIGERDIRMYKPGAAPPFGSGVIKGRLSVPDGMAVSGVGLIPAASMDTYPVIRGDLRRALFLTMSITDGTPPGPDGEFGFAGLPAGEYMLMLSIPGDGGHTVTNPPGVITISEENPVADVGVIELAGGGG